ncbi:MAG: TIGR02594 family protein [Hyphomicrobium sp.]
MEQPAWLAAAWAELGVAEAPGARDDSRVLAFYRDAGHGEIMHDEVAWCAAFAGAMLKRAGLAGTKSLMARSYLNWGKPIEQGRLGAIAVLERGSDPHAGHVGFLIGEAKGKILLLGGNQGDAVSVSAFDAARLIGYRWPASGDVSDAPGAGVAASPLPGGVFADALAHVLDMEGGFSDDPYDPGGPTNRGITLETYARFKGVTVDAVSRARLIDDLKRIPDETVQAIYRGRYWGPAQCAALPDPVAFFHFDASVNHGVGGAARMLQQAVGVAIDGEIGRLSITAVRRIDPGQLIAAYAGIRRARYRALPHFWRFGRGWLRRVDVTLDKAGALCGAPTTLNEASKGASAMEQIQYPTTDTNSAPAGKWWGQSKTVWGALITAAATVLPVFGPLIGIELSGEVVRQAGEQTINVVQAAAGLFGTMLTIYGRLRADGPLTRKDVTVRF